MKKFSLIFAALVASMIIFHLVALPVLLQSKINNAFDNNGIKQSSIKSLHTDFNGITIKSLSFGPARQPFIDHVYIEAFPYLFLLNGNAKNIIIDGLISRHAVETMKNYTRQSLDLLLLKAIDLKAETILIKNMTLHISHEDHKIILEGGLELGKRAQNNQREISGQFFSNTATFNTDIPFKGHLDNQGNGSIEYKINDINISGNLMSLERGSGWLSYIKDQNNEISLAGQIDAGSGSLYDIPLKNINLIIGESFEKFNHDILLRAQAAGIENVTLAIDSTLSKSYDTSAFQALLDIEDMKSFIPYLDKVRRHTTKNLPELSALKQSTVRLTYLPNKKFADGPVPFDIIAKSPDTTILEGTFLIYPDDLQSRGTAQTNAQYTKDIKNLLSLDPDSITEDSIRLDGSLKKLF